MKQPAMLENADLAGLDSDAAAISAAVSGWRQPRAAKRQAVTRIIEYSHYPRSARDEQRRVGFTRDESSSGFCLTTRHSEKKGTLLRVSVRNVDGRSSLDALARVVWCGARGDGSYWIGLALLDLSKPAESQPRRMRKVRRPRPEEQEDEISLTA